MDTARYGLHGLAAAGAQAALGLVLALVLVAGDARAGPRTGQPVPAFTLEALDGSRHALADYRGRVVMINFWATYCAPCVEELPGMQALLDAFADRPFTILAINMGEDRATIAAFLERLGEDFTFPFLLDPGHAVATRYAVRGLPATLLVDRAGRHAFGGIGARDWNGEAARGEILPLFDAPPAPE